VHGTLCEVHFLYRGRWTRPGRGGGELERNVASAGSASSAWAPLRIPVFRALWIASLVSNVGTWMQTVGAQWLVVHDAHAAVLVSLVQTA
jgi:hypothetical protein